MLNFEEMFPNWGQVTDCIYILSAVLYSTDWKYIISFIVGHIDIHTISIATATEIQRIS